MRFRAGITRIILIAASAWPVFSADWKPVTDAELAMKAPRVDKNADAEALLWEVHVVDELMGGQDLQTSRRHYLRIKIFTEKGREYAKVQLEFGRK
jgi:hypothetical protein